MKVLLAGATGAIGTPLTRRLLAAGHEVVGITRTGRGARRLGEAGAGAVVADVLDRPGLLRALSGVRADAVVHELTSLPPTPLRYRDMAATDELRTTGSAHLVEAARLVGARRFVTQSIMLGYGFGDHGDRPLTERDPFGVPVPGPLGRTVAALAAAERLARDSDGLDGVALRYGFFYGPDPGTRATLEALRARRLPVPSRGGPVPFVHVEDAAAATVAALERGVPGRAYNVAGSDAVSMAGYLTRLAAAAGAPRPRRVPLGLLRVMPYAHAILGTSMRLSTDLARRELGWTPDFPDVDAGIAALLGTAGSRRPVR